MPEIDQISLNNGNNRPIVEVKNLSKKYIHPLGTPKKKEEETSGDAVKDVSFNIMPRDSFGFIGPNGAGKTTTIKIISTLLEPTTGEVIIDGKSVVDQPEEVRRVIGYMPDYFGVYDGMKVWEYLDFFASAYRKGPRERKGLVKDVLEITDLTGKSDTFIETLSKGMRQRLCIAKTLLHDPKVLILDEPASGLDPRARIELKELLKELVRMGKTIFISSHILHELADTCNKIGIIEAGKLLAFGSPDEFTSRLNQPDVRVVKMKFLGDREQALNIIKTHPRVAQAKLDNAHIVAEFHGKEEELVEMLEFMLRKQLKIIEFVQKGTDLEDLFLKITKGEVS